MAEKTERPRVTDSIIVELNGKQVDAKGPDPKRLDNHAAERKAFAARLRKESKK